MKETYDYAAVLHMLKMERDYAKGLGDKKAVAVIDGIIRKLKTAR